MVKSSEDRNHEIQKIFERASDWESRYKVLIEVGRGLEPMNEKQKTHENLVRGCQSQVWMVAELSPEGHLLLTADSDALIVRGLVALLLKYYNDLPVKEVLTTSPAFISELGFSQNLTPSRANGLHAMIKQIKFFALAFSSKVT